MERARELLQWHALLLVVLILQPASNMTDKMDLGKKRL
jgi:hypothetical protein